MNPECLVSLCIPECLPWFALVRPGSFQIRESMGLGGRDSAGSKKDERNKGRGLRVARKKSALSCPMGHSGQSIDCKKSASCFAYREWKHNGVFPGCQPKRVRYSLTRRRVVRSVQGHHSVSKLPGNLVSLSVTRPLSHSVQLGSYLSPWVRLTVVAGAGASPLRTW
jgi:hypothetical protein